MSRLSAFPEKQPMAMILVGILGISVSAILVRFSSAPSAVTAALRLCWTVALMTPVTLLSSAVRAELKSLDRRTLLLSILSGLFLAAHFVLWFESLRHTSVAGSTTIVCTEVIWVALGSRLLLGSRLGRKAAAAIAVALAGSVLIAWTDASSSALKGDVLALLAAVAVAAYTLIGRIVREKTSATVYTYIVYCACAAVLLVLCGVQKLPVLGYGISSVAVGLLLAVCSTLLGHSVFSWCLKYFSAAFVSASKLCEPVVAAILAALLFREYPGALQIAGAGLVLTGVLWYSVMENKKR